MDLHENNSPNVLNNEIVDSPNINPTSTENNTRNKFGIIFSRRKPKLGGLFDNLQHGQESSLSPSFEIPSSNSLHEKDKLVLPIALRKGNRECSRGPLYPLSNFVVKSEKILIF